MADCQLAQDRGGVQQVTRVGSSAVCECVCMCPGVVWCEEEGHFFSRAPPGVGDSRSASQGGPLPTVR